jgi:hypothetical protein
MKKGLLSLLALALTVVGCQNYDDQFDELTSQITSLQTAVDGLSGVSSAITTLQTTVAGLATTLGNVSTGVGENATTLETVSSTLADLLAQLDDVATSSDLDTISSTLALVQADVRELLEGNSTINQNLTINSEATLLYAETLVSTGTERPNVIVNGTVTFDTTGFSPEQQTRANEIAKKIATVLNNVTVTSTSTLDFENMTFVDASVTLSGGGADVTELRTVTTNFQSTEIGAIDYSYLSSVGGTMKIIAGDAGATNVNSITSVNFGTATFSDVSVGLAATPANTINAPKATSVVTGNAPVITVTANAATDIDHNYNGTAALASLSITGSGTIDILASKVTGGITLEGVKTSIIYASSLTSTNAFTMTTKVAQLHLPKIKSASGALNAAVVDLTDFVYPQGGNLTISATDVDLTGAKLIYSYGTLAHAGTGQVTVTDAIAADLIPSATTTKITILELDNPFVFAAGYTELHTIDITGKAKTFGTAQANLVTTSAAASMTTITLGGTIDGLVSAGNTKLKTVTTSGNLTDMTITGATALTAVNAGHSHISGDTAVTFVITGATALQTLDMSSVDKVKTITLTGNTKLHTVTAPSTTTLCEAGAAVAVDISDGASFTGVYTNYTPEIPATETTPVIPAIPVAVAQNSLNSLKAWYDVHANRQTASPTFDVDTALVSGTTTYADFTSATLASFGSGTGSGTIDVAAEISTIKAE